MVVTAVVEVVVGDRKGGGGVDREHGEGDESGPRELQAS